MTKDAQLRLEAIERTRELGAGFTLASHDLEIRGTGEILGQEQAGHMQTSALVFIWNYWIARLKHWKKVRSLRLIPVSSMISA